jgi:hypothetical protein
MLNNGNRIKEYYECKGKEALEIYLCSVLQDLY